MHKIALSRARRTLFALLALVATTVAARPAHAATDVARDEGVVASQVRTTTACVAVARTVVAPAPATARAVDEEACFKESLAAGLATAKFGVALALATEAPSLATWAAVAVTGAELYAAGVALNECLKRNAE